MQSGRTSDSAANVTSTGATVHFRCIRGCRTYPLDAAVYSCGVCGALLEVEHPAPDPAQAEHFRALFASRSGLGPGYTGSGVWRYREWVQPDLPVADIVSLGEGNAPLTSASRLGAELGVALLVKQCGHALSGSFKDLGMTVLVSQVNHLRRRGKAIRAIACASTGDTSAALAAYAAAADLPALVLLPRGKISTAQLVEPLAHGTRVIAIDTDFDGCMRHVQKLAEEDGVYLANSKNSLRIEGQKTVAFEIAQGLGWRVPDWVAIPGGNLGNVSALARGFEWLRRAGLIDRLPRLLCAQAAVAAPLFASFEKGFAPLVPVEAGATLASAIRIGNPVSFEKAVEALKKTDGVVDAVSERALAEMASRADRSGLYVCPHTAIALAAVEQQRKRGVIAAGATVVTVATAHGLKFTEMKVAAAEGRGPAPSTANRPVDVADDFSEVRRAALSGLPS